MPNITQSHSELIKQNPAPLLKIRNLCVSFKSRKRELSVVRDFNLTIQKKETHGLVGESGCGKSTIAYSILRYLGRYGRIVSGDIELEGESLLHTSPTRLRQIRSSGISMIYQEPSRSLNPSMRIIEQLAEVPLLNDNVSISEARDMALEMLEKVRIPDPKRVSKAYPHQISGGQQQRVIIAIALLSRPKLLILDEPTTSLDVTIQAGIIRLITELAEETDMTMLFISHNMGLIREVCDSVTVMYAGRAIEVGPVDQLFKTMLHPYSHGLLTSIPSPIDDRYTNPIQSIPGSLPIPGEIKHGCDFFPRCQFAKAHVCAKKPIPMVSVSEESNHSVRCARLDAIKYEKVLSTEPIKQSKKEVVVTSYKDVSKSYVTAGLWPFRKERHVYASQNVSFKAYHSENLAIVGESGCGKTTLMKMLVGLETASQGQITLLGKSVGKVGLSKRGLGQRSKLQYIFQNPFDALNPGLTVGSQLSHILRLNMPNTSRLEIQKELNRILRAVKLNPIHAQSYPRQLSGGQKQRIAIARAYALRPKIVIADEPVSALDVSVQAAIMELFINLQKKHNATLLIISHDLGVVRYLADRVIVMYLGHIVEHGTNESIFSPPYHPYTEALLGAIPLIQSSVNKRQVILEGDIPSASTKSTGCPFFNRCLYAKPGLCDTKAPPVHEFAKGHSIACHIEREELENMSPIFSSAA